MRRPSRSRHSRRRSTAGRSTVSQAPWNISKTSYHPFQILSEDEIESIHLASLKVLRDYGMEILDGACRDLAKVAGASIDGDCVRFDPELIEELIAKAPDKVTVHARNAKHDVPLHPGHTCIASVGGPAFSTDIDNGRRAANFEDMCNFSRLVQSLNIIHMEGGGAVEPVDLPANTRHLDMYMAFATLTDKTWTGYALGADRAQDSIEMAAMAAGLSLEEAVDKPVVLTVINSNSPRRLDGPMGEGLRTYSTYGQPFAATPFTLAGAMAPASVAGATVQQNAEALAMVALAQCVRPGTPVIYGGFTSNVDMKSGSPAFGTPEYSKAVLIGCQLARRYALPYRSSNVTSANAPDAQAAWESMMSLWAAFTGQATLIKQGAGWVEGGLTASFEKFIIDAEMLQMMQAFVTPPDMREQEFGLSAIEEVGPGGHFFSTNHTLERYQSAFYSPLISDWRNFETWQEDGKPEAVHHANRTWKLLLDEYEEPAMDAGTREALEAFVAKRKQQVS